MPGDDDDFYDMDDDEYSSHSELSLVKSTLKDLMSEEASNKRSP